MKGSWFRIRGGCTNYPTWRENPQIAIELDQEDQIEISLTQLRPNLTKIGVYIAEFDGIKKV